jgi:hypothetical protein
MKGEYPHEAGSRLAHPSQTISSESPGRSSSVPHAGQNSSEPIRIAFVLDMLLRCMRGSGRGVPLKLMNEADQAITFAHGVCIRHLELRNQTMAGFRHYRL